MIKITKSAFGRIVDTVQDALDFNQAFLYGCVDIIVVEQPDGTLKSSPWHVRFGKLKLLKSRGKMVNISVNDIEIPFKMKLGKAGEAYFEEEANGLEEGSSSDEQMSDPENAMSSDEELGSPIMEAQLQQTQQYDQKIDIKIEKINEDTMKMQVLNNVEKQEITDLKVDTKKEDSKWVWPWGKLPKKKDKHNYEKDTSAEKSAKNSFMESEKIEAQDSNQKERILSITIKETAEVIIPDMQISNQNKLFKEDKDAKNEKIKSEEKSKKGIFNSIMGIFEKKPKPEKDIKTDQKQDKIEKEKDDKKNLNQINSPSINFQTPLSPNIVENIKKDDFILDESFNTIDEVLDQRNISEIMSEDKFTLDLFNEDKKQEKSIKNKNIDNLSKKDKTNKESEAEIENINALSTGIPKIYTDSPEISSKNGSNDKYLKENEYSMPSSEQLLQVIEKKKTSETNIMPALTEVIEDPLFPIESDNKIVKDIDKKANEVDNNQQNTESLVNNNDKIMSPELTAKTVENKIEVESEGDIELSLCGNLVDKPDVDLDEVFQKYKVSWESYAKDPIKILTNQNLLVRIEDHLYDWKVACPYIVALLAFKKQLPDHIMNELVKPVPKSSWKSWFSRSKPSDQGKPVKKDLKQDMIKKFPVEENKTEEKSKKLAETQEKNKEKPADSQKLAKDTEKKSDAKQEIISNDAKEAAKLKESTKIKDLPAINSINNSHKGSSDAESLNSSISFNKNVKRTLRPTSEMLKSLALKRGANTISYTVYSSLQGIQQIKGHIYLWPKNAKIVISDIDGTITKSDVLGQLMPMVGRDWTHQGVAALYSNIVKNGYYIFYLTSRAIGQANQTKNFIMNVSQGKTMLPAGPVIMSPDRLIPSFKREVIDRRPEVFKIAALKDIKNLFSPDAAPFYAGFGNRDTDAISYRAVEVPMGKIFIINTKSEIHQFFNNSLVNSLLSLRYTKLNETVDEVFPSIHEKDGFIPSEDYNQFNFWRVNHHNFDDLSSLLN